jgi:hypothetical protein
VRRQSVHIDSKIVALCFLILKAMTSLHPAASFMNHRI